MTYIESARDGGEGCLFCSKPRAGADDKELVLERGRSCFTMLNAFPYNTGHLMVAPYRHVDSFAALSTEERVDLIHLLGRAEDILKQEYRPHGFNMGVNLGAAAGAGVVGHLHAHLVPRWTGDTNFMGSVGDTKVLPETLERTFERLRGALDALGSMADPGPGAAP
jgi:ATP adenylyltransferase